MAIFSIGAPVVVVTDRALQGRAASVDSRIRVKFLPQNLQGKKGWIHGRPWDDGEPAYYHVLFRLEDHPRTVLTLEIHKFGPEQSWGVRMRRQAESGWGYVRVRADDLMHDTEPVGEYEEVLFNKCMAGSLDDCPEEVLCVPGRLLAARDASLHPEAYLAWLREWAYEYSEGKRQDILELYKGEWRLFQEEGWHSIHEYIRDYIGGDGGLSCGSYVDWRFLVRAVEQAEHGYRTAFKQLLHYDYDYEMPPVSEVSEPLRAQWEQTCDDCPHSAEHAACSPAVRFGQFMLFTEGRVVA